MIVQKDSFIRLRQDGRTQEVVQRLMEVINLGVFAEGEQLPSELELATQLGVATVTLREALAYLRERGFIETKRGRNGGSFVCQKVEMSEEPFIAKLRAMGALELRDFSDEHIAISGTAARLAAKRATKEHHDNFTNYLQALETANCRLELRRADARFHIEIAVAAQSIRLTHAEMSLQAEIGDLLWLALDTPDNIQAILIEHSNIIDAIVAGDANLAGALTEAHITKGIKKLESLRLSLIAQEKS